MAVTGSAGCKRKVRKPASPTPTPPATRVRSSGLHLNRADASHGVRRGFKFRQFETNAFVRADKVAQQPAQRRQV
jgi:hypothetical protein